MGKLNFLEVGKYEYGDIKDLREKLVELKDTMDEASVQHQPIMMTATAYNIICVARKIELLEHKSKTKSELSRLKIRMRTSILDTLNKHDDPTEALKKLLKELG